MYIARDEDDSLVIFSELPIRMTEKTEDSENCTYGYWSLPQDSDGYGFEVDVAFENVPEEILELTFDDEPIEI